MKGHEYARRMLKDMLEQRVPERLDVIRATVDEQWPPDPRAYLLADSLPMKEEQFPCVLVTSSNGRPNVNLQSGLGEFIYEYELTVGVALVAPRHGGEEMSSIGRDRVLLAVREALMLNAKLADDCFAVTRGMPEATGAAIESIQSKPMSLGNITLAVRVVEELIDPLLDAVGNPIAIQTHDQTALAVDASQPLP